MTYGSVCSGIEAASAAWEPMGWNASFFAEIEKFPSSVLNHHYPEVPNVGDFSRIATVLNHADEQRQGLQGAAGGCGAASDDISGRRESGRGLCGDSAAEWGANLQRGAIDLLVGGTPCQDFSVAGLRAGMDGARGQLTIEFANLAGRLRPRWLVWENVPGVLSIDGGRAFGTFLGLLGQLGYGVAYRVLNAQHFGVPQRRRRVFVVGHLGDWRRAAAVLFERNSMSGHPAPRRETGQAATGGFTFGIDEECNVSDDQFGPLLRGGQGGTRQAVASTGDVSCVHVAPTLRAGGNRTGGDRPPGTDVDTCETLIAHSLRGEGFDASEDGTGRGTPLVTAFSAKDYGADATEGLTPTLRAGGFDKSHANSGNWMAVAIQNATRGKDQNGLGVSDDGSMYTLDQGSQHAVAFGAQMSTPHWQHDLSDTLQAKNPKAVQFGMAVRRLTPRECERLQGFTDDYTKISDKTADGPRYKALGNSFAVPVVRWIGERIQMVENL